MPDTQKRMDDMIAASNYKDGKPLTFEERETAACLTVDQMPPAFRRNLIGILGTRRPVPTKPDDTND